MVDGQGNNCPILVSRRENNAVGTGEEKLFTKTIDDCKKKNDDEIRP